MGTRGGTSIRRTLTNHTEETKLRAGRPAFTSNSTAQHSESGGNAETMLTEDVTRRRLHATALNISLDAPAAAV